MERRDMWDAFVRTGRIEDYLRYRGVDIYTSRTGRETSPAAVNAVNSVSKEENSHASNDRRPDHSGI
ncbi:MAG: hypothetical protein HFJ80_04625 [Clostridiales bacterium]|nr:hypothetical protein [Clostridiales bacterium]